MGTRVATAVTDASGAFSAAGVPAGDYVACVETGAAQGLLDPCHWGPAAPEFSVAGGKATAPLRITIVRGAVIHIHLSDPSTLLKAATGPIDFNCQFHIVTARGIHYIAAISASATGSRDHVITIPFGTPVTLQARAPHLALTDAAGVAVAAAGSSLSVAAGTTPATINFVVAGGK